MMPAALSVKFRKFGSGFTLIELLVVISIIGVLTTLVAANLNSARERARDAERKSDLKNISTALRLYFNDNGAYPASLDWGQPWKSADDKTTYMSTIPNDPLYDVNDTNSPQYIYTPGAPPDEDTFVLTACLENASDKQGKPDTGYGCNQNTIFQISAE